MPVRHEVGVEHRCADLFREHGVPQELSAGAFLFLRGSESRAVYLMEYGLVKVMHESECGKEFVSGFRSTGSILGLSAVVLDAPHPTSAVALQRSKAILLRRGDLMRIASEELAMAQCINKLLARENIEHAENLYRLSLLNAPARLVQFIRAVASQASRDLNPSRAIPAPPILRRDLAAAIAVTPTHLSRLLRRLENRGELIVRGNRIFVHPDRISATTEEFATGDGRAKPFM